MVPCKGFAYTFSALGLLHKANVFVKEYQRIDSVCRLALCTRKKILKQTVKQTSSKLSNLFSEGGYQANVCATRHWKKLDNPTRKYGALPTLTQDESVVVSKAQQFIFLGHGQNTKQQARNHKQKAQTTKDYWPSTNILNKWQTTDDSSQTTND